MTNYNYDRLKAIDDRTPLQGNSLTGLIDDDDNWLIKQLGAAWKRIEKLEGLLTTLATSQCVYNLYSSDKAAKCPECRECIMYMPNDCGTCEDLGKFVTDDSVDAHLKALAGETG